MAKRSSPAISPTSIFLLLLLLALIPLLVYALGNRLLYKSGAAYFINPVETAPYAWYAPDGTKCDNSNSSTALMTYYSQANCLGTTYYHAAGTACSATGTGTCFQIKPQFHVVASYQDPNTKCQPFGPTNLSETNSQTSLCAWRPVPPTPTPILPTNTPAPTPIAYNCVAPILTDNFDGPNTDFLANWYTRKPNSISSVNSDGPNLYMRLVPPNNYANSVEAAPKSADLLTRNFSAEIDTYPVNVEVPSNVTVGPRYAGLNFSYGDVNGTYGVASIYRSKAGSSDTLYIRVTSGGQSVSLPANSTAVRVRLVRQGYNFLYDYQLPNQPWVRIATYPFSASTLNYAYLSTQLYTFTGTTVFSSTFDNFTSCYLN